MATSRSVWMAAVLASLAALAQAQNQQEGQSQVDWYFFDVGNPPEGKMVSVPLTYQRTSRRNTMSSPKEEVTAALHAFEKINNINAADGSVVYSDPGTGSGTGERCLLRSLGSEGVCAPLQDCLWAQRQVQHWGRTEMCATAPSLVCCPFSAERIEYPSASWDPYTHQYYPGCHPHQHKPAQSPLPLLPPAGDLASSLPPRVDYRPEPVGGMRPASMGPSRPMSPSRPSGTPMKPAMPARPMSPASWTMARPVNPTRPMKPAMGMNPSRPAGRPFTPMTEALVPQIDTSSEPLGTSADRGGRKPGDVARKKCVEYERYAPTVRYGPDKDCVPNHTYPIGGNPAVPKEFPHFGQLGVGRGNTIQWYCGGSLIAPTWIMTAAHCLYSEDRRVQWVRLGDIEPESDTDESNPQIIAVAEVVRHPDYKVLQVYNDIALLRLAREPDMSTGHVRPVCLQVDYKLKKDKLNLIGFGLTEENGDPAKELMEVSLKRTPGEECATFFGGAVNLRQLPDGLRDESQLCAGLNQAGKDACQGDSGGPLNTPFSPTCMHYVAGITSFGQGCGRGAPGVYTRVSHFVPWIESVVWPGQ